MCVIVFDWPNWIQAGAAIVLVFLTGWTLKVLREYARDTKTIAETGTKQIKHSRIELENSQMPVLVVVMRTRADGPPEGWVLANQGFGPAINIRFTGYSQGNEPDWKPTPPIGHGTFRLMHTDIAEVLARWQFEVQYESLSGLKYRTTARTAEAGLQTQFYKPE